MSTRLPLNLKRLRFPWRSGHRFHLHVDGKRFYPAMLQAIEGAQQFILLEMYLIESGLITTRFIDALVSARRRGVGVYLLFDDFGARGLLPSDRQRLHDASVQLTFYNPLHYGKWRRNLWRDHRKLLVVDSRIAFTGGAGITDDFFADEALPWHDLMLGIEGPCVRDWQKAFAAVWRAAGNRQRPIVFPATEPPLPAGPSTGRVTLNEPARMDIKRSLLKHLHSAEQRVWIASAYFIPSRRIRRALYRAARRGLDVRLLLPGPHTDHPGVRHASRRYYARLLSRGIRIFEYQPRFLHAKILLCDTWVSIGSSNIDRWNFSWNLEANQEIEDHGLANEVAALFQQDFADSREILCHEWRHRPWYRHLQEYFFGLIERWLEKLGRRTS